MKTAIQTAALLLCASPAVVQQTAAQKTQRQPNIVVILLDDVGYSDLGCYGSEIPTPNIDRLAENGVRFRTFYNNARSAPTRAALLTGLYPHQAGNGALGKVPGYAAYQGYPNKQNVFIPEVLRQAGYFNVMTGKWHLGYFQGVTPITRGFDRSLNAPFGGYYFWNDPTYKNAGRKELTNTRNLYLNDQELAFDDPRLPANWYSTDLWVEYGLKFVDEAIDAGKPFFWYLAHNAAHFPLQAPAETIAKYKGKYMGGWDEVRNARYKRQLEMGLFTLDEPLTPRNPLAPQWDKLTRSEKERYDTQMAVYAAVIDELDKNTGKMVEHLRRRGVLDNTVIILLSDNGGNGEPRIEGVCEGGNPGSAGSKVFIGAAWADVANTPYFLYKHHGHEGGCNTPFIVSYPAGIDKANNRAINKQVYGHVVDIMPTVLELAGAKYPTRRGSVTVPPEEGVSVVPAFNLGPVERSNPIIMEHEGNRMLRYGDWKIVSEYTETAWMLYNMKDDPTEMNDLAASDPAKLSEMIVRYEKMARNTGVVDTIQFKVGKWYVPVQDYLKKKK